MDWSDGYVSDVGYTTGFYRELAPSFLHFAALIQGQAAPDPAQPFTYCELGCGQGFATNVLAAAYPHGRFVGIDFNPAQIANARRLAADGGLDNVTFRDDSFRQAADLPADDLPMFDFVTLHGIYSWVSPENRQALVRFIERKLKPGGLVYVSYNCMPGWAALEPFQRLLREHADRNPARSDHQAGAGMAFVQKLRDAEMSYFTQNPRVGKVLDAAKDKDRAYLAHEYLNGTWQPLFFPDVAKELSAAKLDYVGSASLLENFESIALTKAAREAIAEVGDSDFREMLKDYASNQQFRRDIYVKGADALTSPEKKESLLDLPFQPLVSHDQVTFTFRTPLGQATGQTKVYEPLVQELWAGNNTVRKIAANTGFDFGTLLQALAALVANGCVHPARTDGDAAISRQFNAAVARKVLLGHPFRYVAAPVAGNGIHASDVELTILSALSEGVAPETEPLAKAAWGHFRRVGRRLTREGQPIEDEQDNLDELQTRTRNFLESRLQVWRDLGVL